MRKKGFTIIELLIVAAIIGVLASVAVLNFNKAQVKSRDTRRMADIAQANSALVMYYNDNHSYPATPGSGGNVWYGGTGNAWGVITNDWVPNMSAYLTPLPIDPIPDASIGRVYLYRSDGTNYKILSHVPENCQDKDASNIVDPARDGGSNAAVIDGNTCWAWAYYSSGAITW